jgi:hypothetical protein
MQIATNSTSTKTDKQGQERTPSLFSDANGADIRRAKAWLDNRFALSSKGMFSEVMTITPAMAEYILHRCNKNNRPLSTNRSEKYAKFIKNGDWMLTSQGISFSPDGFLNNGQHRLSGCILAATPINVLVVFGENRDAFHVLDTNGVRGGGDVLAIAGYHDTKHLAATARTVKAIINDNWIANPIYTNSEILEFVQTHGALVDALKHGTMIAKKLNCSRSALASAFYLIVERSRRAELAEDFRDRLASGKGLDVCPSLLALRDGIMQRTIDAQYKISFLRNIAISAATVTTWNHFVRGRRGKIKFVPGSKYPEVF